MRLIFQSSQDDISEPGCYIMWKNTQIMAVINQLMIVLHLRNNGET